MAELKPGLADQQRRRREEEELAEARRRRELPRLVSLLRGAFWDDSLRFERRALKFFVSSTFTDTAAERDALNKRVYPALRARARERGIAFEAAEMRWGVTKSLSDDNRTDELCMAKLRQCRDESGGLFFLSVWNDK